MAVLFELHLSGSYAYSGCAAGGLGLALLNTYVEQSLDMPTMFGFVILIDRVQCDSVGTSNFVSYS